MVIITLFKLDIIRNPYINLQLLIPFIQFEAKVRVIRTFAHHQRASAGCERFSELIGFSWIPHLCTCSCKLFLDLIFDIQFDKWDPLSWVGVHGTSQRPITTTPLNDWFLLIGLITMDGNAIGIVAIKCVKCNTVRLTALNCTLHLILTWFE